VVEARGDVGDDEVRVRISGCQGGAALARLEGVRGKATVRQRAMGGLPETGVEEVSGGEENLSQKRCHRTCGGRAAGVTCSASMRSVTV
jgi:hypothetical protein